MLAIYVWFRPHGLDDRYLVILAPFVALAAGVAVVGLGRWSRRAALGAALALVALGTVDALHVAYLFWTDDTRQLALRWRQRALPPDARPTSLPGGFAQGGPSAQSAILVTDTQSDDRHHVWYSGAASGAGDPARSPGSSARGSCSGPSAPAARVHRADDQLLRPRVDGRAVCVSPARRRRLGRGSRLPRCGRRSRPGRRRRDPGAPGPGRLVPRAPVPRLALALAGEGRILVRSGAPDSRLVRRCAARTIVEIAPWRGFPWFKPVYRLGLEPGEGRVAVRLLRTPCEVAERLLALEDWAGAIRQLDACRGTRWMEPARLLDLAWAHARAGQPDGARAALGDLQRVAPGLLEGLVDLAARPDGDAWRARYATLVGRGRFTGYGQIARAEAESSPARSSARSSGTPGPSGGQFLRGPRPASRRLARSRSGCPSTSCAAGTSRPSGCAARPRPGDPSRASRSSGTFPGRGYDAAASLDWTPRAGPAGWEDVVLPFTTDQEPVDFELQVHYHGRGTLDMDRATIMPDVRAALAERVATLVTIPAAPAPPR